jgi:hypothetical protein
MISRPMVAVDIVLRVEYVLPSECRRLLEMDPSTRRRGESAGISMGRFPGFTAERSASDSVIHCWNSWPSRWTTRRTDA